MIYFIGFQDPRKTIENSPCCLPSVVRVLAWMGLPVHCTVHPTIDPVPRTKVYVRVEWLLWSAVVCCGLLWYLVNSCLTELHGNGYFWQVRGQVIIIFLSTNYCFEPRRGWWMKLKIASAGLGVVMGVLVFVIFTFIYGELWSVSCELFSWWQSQVTSLLGSGRPCRLWSPLWFSTNISCSAGAHSPRSTIPGGQT